VAGGKPGSEGVTRVTQQAAFAGFIDAILTDPADDAVRLIAADFLDDRGEHERAEFIRMQVELAKTDQWLPSPSCDTCQSTGNCPDCDGAGELAGDYFADDGMSPCERCRGQGVCNECGGEKENPRWVYLRRRERDLWPRVGRWFTLGGLVADIAAMPRVHWGEPGADLRDTICADVRRGFVADVACPCDLWLTHGPALVRSQPVERVTLTDREPMDSGWVWLNADHWFQWWSDSMDRAGLPQSVFALLPGFVAGLAPHNHILSYPTRALALDAVSAALLRAARGQPRE
jgi:uncharacterized protein (TIGR02996 family)